MSLPDDDAPPFAVYCNRNPLGLNARSYLAARARIDGLLVGADEIRVVDAALRVREACGGALVGALTGPLEREVAMRGAGCDVDLSDAVARAAHEHDAVTAAAWHAFGPPNEAGVWSDRKRTSVEWTWQVRGPDAVGHLALWSPFVVEHDRLMWDSVSTKVAVRALWVARLRVASGLVAAPYPLSRIHAFMGGRYSSVFPDLVLPHVAITPAFVADCEAVDRAFGIRVPQHRYRLCAPKRRGSGRVYRRLTAPEQTD